MAFVPAVVVTAGIAVVSLWENPQVPQALSMSDKVAHGLMYTVMAMAWAFPILKSQIINLKSQIPLGIGVCLAVTAYGALMEVLQRFCTLTRSGEMADLYADFFGALAGVGMVYLIALVRSVVLGKTGKSNND
jgi:VanZ family protein